ncbi:aminodeoxychorismate lyase [Aureibacter tunicatorum]|nr:aminodeoxychorismate lyase [Aureibacter tunicatorum]
MFSIYNNELLSSSQINIPITDRAFQYGDGVFETILYAKNSDLIKYHFERLYNGSRALNFNLPSFFTPEHITNSIEALKNKNNIKGLSRIKIMVWRKEGGLYTPVSDQSNILISISEGKFSTNPINKVGICETVKNEYSSTSRFKTISALKYTLAGLEKKNKHFDDLIILDQHGHISECLASNIFWVKDNEFYTPDLSTGCIEGVQRRRIIELLKENNIRLNIGKFHLEELENAQLVFNCNVASIHPFAWLMNKSLKINTDLFKLLIPSLD